MFLLFFAVWVLLNGRLDWQVAAFGAVLCGVLYAFCCRFLHYSPRRDWEVLCRLPRLMAFGLTLLGQIVHSAFALLPYVYGKKQPDAAVVRFSANGLRSEAARVFLANAITMTPGTITGSLTKEGVYLVHCLDRPLAQGLADGPLAHRLEKWEAK